jgi:hypothetical protein
MWPGYQVRIGHVERLKFTMAGHGQREIVPSDRVSTFPVPLLHYTFSHGLKASLEKHVRYADDEARANLNRLPARGAIRAALFGSDSVERRRGAKALASLVPLFARPIVRFLYIYVYRLGFLDGITGFVYAFLVSVYEGMIALLIYEMRFNRLSARRKNVRSDTT